MRLIKGLVLFCFLGALISSCFNPPEFRNRPEIIFKKIYFGDSPGFEPDSLVLVFDFKDGDGDLGLDDNFIDSPYNSFNFYAEAAPLQLIAPIYIDDYSNVKWKSGKKPPKNPKYYIRDIEGGGKIVTYNSRSNGFPNLPAYAPPASKCWPIGKSYFIDTVWVAPKYGNSVDPDNIVDTLVFINNNEIAALAVVDTFYTEENLKKYNLTVRFYQKVGSDFQEYDWRKEFCQTFDGKFPPFNEKSGPTEGTISYSMKSVGFSTVFTIKRLYLEFEIKDRSLNVSNTDRTPEFTLDEIKQK